MLFEVKVKLQGKADKLNLSGSKRVFTAVVTNCTDEKTAKKAGIKQIKNKIAEYRLFKERPSPSIKGKEILIRQIYRIDPAKHEGIVVNIAKKIYTSLQGGVEYQDIINEINLTILTHSSKCYNPAYKETTFIMSMIPPIARKNIITKYMPHIRYTEKEKLRFKLLKVESLYEPIGNGNEIEDILLINNIPDLDEHYLTGKEYENSEIDVIIRRVIKNYLNEQQQNIIIHRYNLDNKGKWTFEELANSYKITKQAIQQKTKKSEKILINLLGIEYEAIQFREQWEKMGYHYIDK